MPNLIWSRMLKRFKEEEQDPPMDRAYCCVCETWYDTAGLATETETTMEGWLTYEIHVCPTCDDGGCICDYDCSKSSG